MPIMLFPEQYLPFITVELQFLPAQRSRQTHTLVHNRQLNSQEENLCPEALAITGYSDRCHLA
jgi:hypothetical protein